MRKRRHRQLTTEKKIQFREKAKMPADDDDDSIKNQVGPYG
jgi:hypothetical protein